MTSEDVYFEDKQGLERLRIFITTCFGCERCLPSLEAVFGLIDYTIGRQDGLGPDLTIEIIHELRKTMVLAIHNVIAHFANGPHHVYNEFWKNVGQTNTNVSVVTLNYDTLLDEGFDALYPSTAFLDYCIPLMNYLHYPLVNPFNWWDDARKPVTIWKESSPVPIKVIKIHGSLNWKYCSCCNQVLLTPCDSTARPRPTEHRIEPYHTIPYPVEVTDGLYRCPFDGAALETLIVPPAHIKNFYNSVVSRLVEEVAFELRAASHLVFVGYSFPDADIHIRAQLLKNYRQRGQIHVVNPDATDSLQSKFSALSNNIHFHETKFEDFVSNGLVDVLKSCSSCEEGLDDTKC